MAELSILNSYFTRFTVGITSRSGGAALERMLFIAQILMTNAVQHKSMVAVLSIMGRFVWTRRK